MSREWKPGDVALWKFWNDIVGEPVIKADDGGLTWLAAGGECFPAPNELRPLVVIDPQDHEDLWREFQSRREQGMNPRRALREAVDALANQAPPKPDEPMGLGAVAIDTRGVRWVRTETAVGMTNPWQPALHPHEPDRVRSLPWADIAAVRVLTEGVPS